MKVNLGNFQLKSSSSIGYEVLEGLQFPTIPVKRRGIPRIDANLFHH